MNNMDRQIAMEEWTEDERVILELIADQQEYEMIEERRQQLELQGGE